MSQQKVFVFSICDCTWFHTAHLYNCWLFVYRKADLEQSDPFFENPGAKRAFLKERLEISEPTFISTTISRPVVSYTVLPSRTAPQVSVENSCVDCVVCLMPDLSFRTIHSSVLTFAASL